MAHRPRWQSLSGMAVTAVILISACSTGNTGVSSAEQGTRNPGTRKPSSRHERSQQRSQHGSDQRPQRCGNRHCRD